MNTHSKSIVWASIYFINYEMALAIKCNISLCIQIFAKKNSITSSIQARSSKTGATHHEKAKIVTKFLNKLRGGIGIPLILWRGMWENQMVTVTECLGPNLKKLFLMMERNFSVATVAMIGIQLLTTLENIHKNEIVCCNIMPKEILISLNKKVTAMYITDFKQAKKISSNVSKQALDKTNFAANRAILNKFSSVNLHLGLPPSKKDDLESLCYILVYFLKGQIFTPYKKVSKEEKVKYYEQQKLGLIIEDFCSGLPSEITNFLSYVKTIQMNYKEDKVDYEYLKKLLRTIFNREVSNKDTFQYDWIKKAISMSEGQNGDKKGDSEEANYLTDSLTLLTRFSTPQNIKQLIQTRHQECSEDESPSEKSEQERGKVKKLSFFAKFERKVKEADSDDIIFALDKNLGFDYFSVPDEGAESINQPVLDINRFSQVSGQVGRSRSNRSSYETTKTRQKSTSPSKGTDCDDPPQITRAATEQQTSIFSQFKLSKTNELMPDLLLQNHKSLT